MGIDQSKQLESAKAALADYFMCDCCKHLKEADSFIHRTLRRQQRNHRRVDTIRILLPIPTHLFRDLNGGRHQC